MKNIKNKTKTILFASLIAAMILPFSGMNYAEAEIVDKIGKDIVKQQSSFDKTSENTKDNQIVFNEKYNPDIEREVTVQQDALLEVLMEKYQGTDKDSKNYFPWTSLGYDYDDNALEVTINPTEFNEKDIKKYQKIIRSIVGKSIDVTISPMEEAVFTSCSSRTNCNDLESGVEIGMTGKTFPCSLGFAATYGGDEGFITAGHCFASLSVGTDAKHPETGSHIGDLVEELYGPNTYVYCDCAFVESDWNDIPNGETYGMADASSTGSTFTGKSVKSSLSQSGIETGSVQHHYVHLYIPSDSKYLIGVARTDVSVQGGDSGAGVFSDDGSELLGIMVAKTGSQSYYVKHDKITDNFSGLAWDFP